MSEGRDDGYKRFTAELDAEAPKTKDELQIGIALSGGGLRAAVFHLGVLGRLADEGLMESVSMISTVSGGSLAAGLIHTLSSNVWPSSEAYLKDVLPEARRLITTKDLQIASILRLLRSPSRLLAPSRWANVLADTLKDLWGVNGLVRDLPERPRWISNATTYEKGKNWRFMHHRMGDYQSAQVFNPPVPVADSMAASAGFPVLIGFLELDTSDYEWRQYLEGSRSETRPHQPAHRKLHLWDGGVYDNLGVEALIKPIEGFRPGFNFLVVSDASTALDEGKGYKLSRQARRLLSISMDQVRSLRSRIVFHHFSRHPGSGVYLLMARTARSALEAAKVPKGDINEVVAGCMPDEEAGQAARYPTTLRKMSESDFDLLYSHGWQIADCNLRAHRPDIFRLVTGQSS
ncbi:MAG: patatin [Actinobacteria bacterium]|nr:MAG: patatin [Actinomycetota bacterium]